MQDAEWQRLIAGTRRGDRPAMARLITCVERRERGWQAAMEEICGKRGAGRVVGITGPPGAGKSTLTGKLAEQLLQRGRSVAVLAIDPSSPITGGAVLADRLRMEGLGPRKVFVRSMATRGSHGGLSAATSDAVRVLDASGFERILIETVGAGQDEVDIAEIADVTIVVCIPGQGDRLQALKAGMMEIADIFAVNKSDLAGANRVTSDLAAVLRLTYGTAERQPPIIATVAVTGSGVGELAEAVERRLIETAAPSSVSGALSSERIAAHMIDAELRRGFWESDLVRAELDRLRSLGHHGCANPYSIMRKLLTEEILAAFFARVRANAGDARSVGRHASRTA